MAMAAKRAMVTATRVAGNKEGEGGKTLCAHTIVLAVAACAE
jgi:hypothetical protein